MTSSVPSASLERTSYLQQTSSVQRLRIKIDQDDHDVRLHIDFALKRWPFFPFGMDAEQSEARWSASRC